MINLNLFEPFFLKMISTGSKFTSWTQSYDDLQKGKSGWEHEYEWVNLTILPYETKHSRVDQVKYVEDSLLKI